MNIPSGLWAFLLSLIVHVLCIAASKRGRGNSRDVVIYGDTVTRPTEVHLVPRPERDKNKGPNSTLTNYRTGKSVSRNAHLDSSHCQNGGTGFLRTFCFCPPKFTGRYCESRVNSSCGSVAHGDWTYRNCSTCYCIDGVFKYCRAHELEGCIRLSDKADDRSKLNGYEVELDTASSSPGYIAPHRSITMIPTCLLLIRQLHNALFR